MSLLPYFFDELPQRRRLQNQILDMDLCEDDFTPIISMRKFLRPLKNLPAMKDIGSNVVNDKERFEITLDVQDYSPEEITVKTCDGYVVVEGKHEESQDEDGYVSRTFKRRYGLPEDCHPEAVESNLSSDRVLTITAPKTTENERAVTITRTGPVRRKLSDKEGEEVENGEEETSRPAEKRLRK